MLDFRIHRLVFVGYSPKQTISAIQWSIACLDGAGAASEAAHEPRIAGALAHWSAHPMRLARRQFFRRVPEGCCRSRLEQLSRALQCSTACCRHQRRPSQLATAGKWSRWRWKSRSREGAMCADRSVSDGWLVAWLTSSVCGRRTLRGHLHVSLCERRCLLRTVINSVRY